jgi:hypothetical protein
MRRLFALLETKTIKAFMRTLFRDSSKVKKKKSHF